MANLIRTAIAVTIIILLETWCSASAIWSLEGVDNHGREFTGSYELDAEFAHLTLELTGDDGTTLFSDTFARFAESSAEAPQLILTTDFDGPLGGSVTAIGDNLLSTEIDVGTVPALTSVSFVVWDGFFQSASNTDSVKLESVSVPEAAGLFGMFSALASGAIWVSMRRQ